MTHDHCAIVRALEDPCGSKCLSCRVVAADSWVGGFPWIAPPVVDPPIGELRARFAAFSALARPVHWATP